MEVVGLVESREAGEAQARSEGSGVAAPGTAAAMGEVAMGQGCEHTRLQPPGRMCNDKG